MTEVLSFWNRRRAAVEAEAEAEVRAELAVQEAEREDALADKDDAEILEEMGLPDPAQMKQGDDFTAFMCRDVPERLRRQALRTLWRSNPVLACVDGLNDYDDDYRLEALGQGPIKTAYQVGKGMTAHIEEMERKAQAALADQEPCEDVSPAEDADIEMTALAEDKGEVVTQEPPAALSDPEQDEEHTPVRRHMRFRFEEASV